jgi:hypothetical protein
MESNKQNSKQNVSGNRQKSQGARDRESFEGMNFEQQRGSYKNSDGAGISGKDEGRKSRNGQSAPE